MFWAKLNTDVSAKEQHDFSLNKVDNDRYSLVISADYHLANRNNDDAQFKATFLKRMQELKAASHYPVYNTILGDLSWDVYWYANNYNLKDFVNTMKTCKFPLITFPVIGNHDNNPGTPEGPDTDFEASMPWRTIMCPNYLVLIDTSGRVGAIPQRGSYQFKNPLPSTLAVLRDLLQDYTRLRL